MRNMYVFAQLQEKYLEEIYMLLLVWKVNVKGCSIAGEIFMRNISDKYLGEIFMFLLV